MKKTTKLKPVETIEGQDGTVYLYDCQTGAHRWPCSDMALLCCNGFTARYFPGKDIPEEAILVPETTNHERITTIVYDANDKLLFCTAGLLPDNSPHSSRYKIVHSRLEPSFTTSKMRPPPSTLNLQTKGGIDYLPADLQDFLLEGIFGSTQYKDSSKRFDAVRILLMYVLVLHEHKVAFFWKDQDYLDEFCKQNAQHGEGFFSLLKEIIEYHKKWKASRDAYKSTATGELPTH